ncbi:MAG: preprotein translocase subunit SecG [Oligoflexales bacterium]
METLVSIVHVLACTFIILVVLIQGGNQGGVGAAFGGGNSQGVFGASGATSLLGKLTFLAGLCFVVTCISLSVMQGQGGKVGLYEKIKLEKEKSSETVPAE